MTRSHCYCSFFFFFFFFVFLFLHSLASSCLQDQRDALLEFRDEFPSYVSDQTQKTTISSWNNNTDCCSWKGITCDDQSGEVISLTLTSDFLNTSLKHNSALFKLQSLRNLSLGHCYLFGEIPSSLGNLSLLTLLDLSTNSFIGNIPTSFTNFTKLSQLNLSKNQLTGSNLPLILPNLISLTSLNLTYNHFKFTLPPDMNRLQNLETVLLSGNSFSGPFPVFLFAIPALLVVNLEENQFTGPLEFSNRSLSSRLHSLYLAHNQFNGPIPESLSQFSNLQMLELSHNNFTGSIPRSISKLLNLYYLGLSNNNLEGEVPSCIWRLKAVTLAQNSFTSFADLSEAENETRISEVDLSSNSFQGQFPSWMCKLGSLSILDLSNNLFNGVIPSCLRGSSNSLVQLILRNNSFSGNFPEIFVNGSSLKSLDVSQNKLEGKLPRTLINCRAIEFLNVKSNKFKDEFPFWLGSLPSLHVFILRSNQFHGTLYNQESSIGFKSLRVIDVSNNEFTGDFPSSYFANWREMATLTDLSDLEPPYMGVEFIWTMYSSVDYGNSMQMVNKGVETEFERILKDYRAIDFSGNRFYGQIPESIGLLKELRLLNLSGNAFTGYIPQSLSNLTNLETLDLSRNQLSGQIPQDLGTLAFLSNMNFSQNHLEGPVPRGTQFQSQNCSSFMGNFRLYGLEEICGEILVPDLTPEPSEEEVVMNWIAAAVAYGPGLFCGLVIGFIFTSQKHEWFEEKFSRNKPRAIRLIR